ncbi:hypothetical protein F5Y18DRAFT_429338 [Xylariaceae sp. FL1019]|nr:hypothetical protein F5Y18DRAFT_429338 [Xylariaceae sp. FL1019]
MVAIPEHGSSNIIIKRDTTALHALKLSEDDFPVGATVLAVFSYIYFCLLCGREPISSLILGVLWCYRRSKHHAHLIAANRAPAYGTFARADENHRENAVSRQFQTPAAVPKPVSNGLASNIATSKDATKERAKQQERRRQLV